MVNRRSAGDRIVITGVGVVAPNGVGKEEFWKNCIAGISGVKPVTLFDTSKYRCHLAGEVSNFQPAVHLEPKGLRNLDRTTLLALVAAKLAIEDSALEITDDIRNDVGVVLGSTMGSVHSISEFDKEGLREGPRFVNPALFPNTVINSPASQIAIRFGLRGLNATISTGFSASLDAVSYAADALRLGRARALLVGGVEELCIQTFLGFYKLGLLSRSVKGSPIIFAPFDRRHCGTLLGEGAAILVLESLEHAKERGATICGEIVGYGTYFSTTSMYRYDSSGENAAAAVQKALEDADLLPEQLDCISACANGFKSCDVMEAKAIQRVFGEGTQTPAVSAIKSMIGESFSAAGAIQIAAAVNMILEQKIPPTINQQQSDPSCELNHVMSEAKDLSVRRVLINAFGPMGISSAMVVGDVNEN